MRSPATATSSTHLLETAMPIDETPETPTEFAILAKTTTRRTMLKGAAAAGVTAATAGIVADILFAGPASAATESSSPSDDGDLIAHVTNVRSGEIDLYVGTRHVSVRDRALAAASRARPDRAGEPTCARIAKHRRSEGPGRRQHRPLRVRQPGPAQHGHDPGQLRARCRVRTAARTSSSSATTCAMPSTSTTTVTARPTSATSFEFTHDPAQRGDLPLQHRADHVAQLAQLEPAAVLHGDPSAAGKKKQGAGQWT